MIPFCKAGPMEEDLRTRIREELAQPTLAVYRWGTLAMGIYLLALVPLHARTTSGREGSIQALISGLVALVMGIGHLWFRRPRLSPTQRNLGVTLCMLALLVQMLSHMALRAKPDLTSDVMLWIVGAGVIFTHRTHYLVALATATAAWAALIPLWPAHSGFLHWSIGMFTALLVSVLTFTHLQRILQAHEELRIADRLREREQEHLITWLKDSIDSIKTLKGLIPICAQCKKVRNDQGYWQQVEHYMAIHSDAEFTHGLCPECGEAFRAETRAHLQHPG